MALSPVSKPLLEACIDGGDPEIEAFIRDSAQDIESAVFELSRVLSNTTFIDDYRLIVREHAWKLALAVKKNPKLAYTGHTLRSMLFHRARPECTNFTARESSSVSGVVNVHRRSVGLDVLRSELSQKMGRSPNNTELVETYNERMRKTRKDPKKQGVLATVEDVGAHRRMSRSSRDDDASSISELDRAAAQGGWEVTPVIASWEGQKFHQYLVEAARAKDPKLGRCAEVWFDHIWSDREGDVHDLICLEIGVKMREARNVMGVIRDLAREVLAERLGVTESDL